MNSIIAHRNIRGRLESKGLEKIFPELKGDISMIEKTPSELIQEVSKFRIIACCKQHEYQEQDIETCENRPVNIACGHTEIVFRD